jgi:hypothetical protein
MSQRSVEIILGRILTDEDFRRSFFPVQPFSFELAAAHGLELTAVERSALSNLRKRRFDFIAQTLDPRISRWSSWTAGSAAAKESDADKDTLQGAVAPFESRNR